MQVELHINGKLSLELTPETDIERLVLAQMYAGADKGKALLMSALWHVRSPRPMRGVEDEELWRWKYAVEVER